MVSAVPALEVFVVGAWVEVVVMLPTVVCVLLPGVLLGALEVVLLLPAAVPLGDPDGVGDPPGVLLPLLEGSFAAPLGLPGSVVVVSTDASWYAARDSLPPSLFCALI